jgi:hypothetical protein
VDVVVMESVRCNSEQPSSFEKALALKSFFSRMSTYELARLISRGSLNVTVIGGAPSSLTIAVAVPAEQTNTIGR